MWIRTLDAAEPRRLVLRDGRWTLELEELVRCFGSVYRPVRHELSGEGPILELLGYADGRARLKQEASRIFGSAPETSPAIYDAFDGSWQQRPPEDDVRLLRVPGSFARMARSNALGLRQVRERSRRALLARRQQLREGVDAAFPATRPSTLATEARATEAAVEPPLEQEYPEEQPRLKPFSATADSEPPPPRARASIPLPGPHPDAAGLPTSETPADDAAEASPDAAEAAPDDVPEEPAAEPPPRVRFPPVAALSDNLIMLLGEEPGVEETRGDAVDLDLAQLDGSHAMPLLDTEGEEICLWIVDAFASQALGAGLRGLPAEERELLRDALDADAELTDATAEILGTLVGTLAAVEGNPKLHAGDFVALDPAAHTWLGDAREHLLLELEGYGRIYGLGR